MHKLVALYKVPQDKEAFDKYYKEVHIPLTAKIPKLKEVRINKVKGSPTGASEFYLMAELCFASKEDFKEGMSSLEAQASGKDTMNFAKGLVSVHFAQEEVITL